MVVRGTCEVLSLGGIVIWEGLGKAVYEGETCFCGCGEEVSSALYQGVIRISARKRTGKNFILRTKTRMSISRSLLPGMKGIAGIIPDGDKPASRKGRVPRQDEPARALMIKERPAFQVPSKSCGRNRGRGGEGRLCGSHAREGKADAPRARGTVKNPCRGEKAGPTISLEKKVPVTLDMRKSEGEILDPCRSQTIQESAP